MAHVRRLGGTTAPRAHAQTNGAHPPAHKPVIKLAKLDDTHRTVLAADGGGMRGLFTS